MLQYSVPYSLTDEYFTVWIHLELLLEPRLLIDLPKVKVCVATHRILELYHQGTRQHTTSADIVAALVLFRLQEISAGNTVRLLSIWKTSCIIQIDPTLNETSSVSRLSTTPMKCV
jgi:hypothetical protein